MAAHYTGDARVLRSHARILDGATGTELERRGVSCALPLWSTHALLHAPDVLREVHRDYAAAGAHALTANTFRTQAHVLAREHAAHAKNLVRADVDALLIETLNTPREAEAALRAAREAGADALVSFVCGSGARLLSGEPLAEAIERVRPLAPIAVGVNCAPWAELAACLPVLREAGIPFSAYANLGAPALDGGFVASRELAAERFADEAARWTEAGAEWVGGCCGTQPAQIAAIAARLLDTSVRPERVRPGGRSAPE